MPLLGFSCWNILVPHCQNWYVDDQKFEVNHFNKIWGLFDWNVLPWSHVIKWWRRPQSSPYSAPWQMWQPMAMMWHALSVCLCCTTKLHQDMVNTSSVIACKVSWSMALYLKYLPYHLITPFHRNAFESSHVSSHSCMLIYPMTSTHQLVQESNDNTGRHTVCECHRTTIYMETFEKPTKWQ